MKTRLILSFILMTILLSCSQDNVNNDLTSTVDKEAIQLEKHLAPLLNYDRSNDLNAYRNDETRMRGKAVTRTLKLRSSGTISLLFPPFNECEASEVRVVVEGEGNGSHLGLFQVDITYCSFDGINSEYQIYGSQTAANGDIIFGALVGAGDDPELGTYQDWVFYDGTGRFEGATGEIRLFIVFDFENATWRNHGVGTLTY